MPPPFCKGDIDCREYAKWISDDGSEVYCDKHVIGVDSCEVHLSRLCKSPGCNNKRKNKYCPDCNKTCSECKKIEKEARPIDCPECEKKGSQIKENCHKCNKRGSFACPPSFKKKERACKKHKCNVMVSEELLKPPIILPNGNNAEPIEIMTGQRWGELRNIFMNFWMNVCLNMVGKGLHPLGRDTAGEEGTKQCLEERINELIALFCNNEAICMAALSPKKGMFSFNMLLPLNG